MFSYTSRDINILSIVISILIISIISLIINIFNITKVLKANHCELVFTTLGLTIPISYEGYIGVNYATHNKITKENEGNVAFDIYNKKINDKLTYIKENDIITYCYNDAVIEYVVRNVSILQRYDFSKFLDISNDKLFVLCMDNSRIIYIEALRIEEE